MAVAVTNMAVIINRPALLVCEAFTKALCKIERKGVNQWASSKEEKIYWK